MENQEEMTVSIKYVQDWSVVRLDDGRVGYKGHSTREQEQIVLFSENTGKRLKPTDHVTVLMHPAQLAMGHVCNEPVKTRAEIEAQIDDLHRELEKWQREAEAAILRQNWQSRAANNCTRCYERINALKWVLKGEPLSTLRDD